MNINDVLKEYRTVEEKNIIITDPNGNLLYKSEKWIYGQILFLIR